MKRQRSAFLASVAVLVVTAPGPVQAQEASPAAVAPTPSGNQAAAPSDQEANQAGDIIVTAQKREQRLIDVPIAITAVSSEALTTQSLNRITDFYDRVPGLQYAGQRVSNLSLRGITTGSTAGGPTVALLVDDVPFGGTTGAGQPPLPDFDPGILDRIEVLRGPQGTLYGAASLGGLIKYVLKQPDTDRISGRIEATGDGANEGNAGYAVRGSLNVPVTDWLAVTGSGFKRNDPAYLDNAMTGRTDVNPRDAWGFRGAVLVKPTDRLTITGSVLKQKVDALNSDLAVTSGGVPVCIPCTNGGTAATRATAVTTFEPVYGDLTIKALDSVNNSTFTLYTGRAEYDLGPIKLTSISAWDKADNIITSDVTAVFGFLPPIYAPGGTVQIGNADKTTKFSEEFRGAGSFGRFDYLLGVFYTVEHAATTQTLFVRDTSGSLVIAPYTASGPSRYRETAGFADLTWHPTDKLDIQLGGRYATNAQYFNSFNAVDAKAQPVFGASATYIQSSSDSAFTFLVSPTYHFSRDIIGYVRIANGYRPGGPNLDNSGVGNYGPDRVVNYEVGFKGRVVPNLLTIDTALFQIDWTNIQLQGTSANNFTYVTNGGRARSRGLEFSANVTPWRGMAIDGNLTFTDAEITEALPHINASSLSGQAGDRLPFSAKFTSSITAQQSVPLSDRLVGTFSVNNTYIGDRAAAFDTYAGTRPRILIPGYDTVNLTAGLTFDRVWSATLFLRNAGDERGISVAQNRNGTNVPTALFIQPRTIGLTLARSF